MVRSELVKGCGCVPAFINNRKIERTHSRSVLPTEHADESDKWYFGPCSTLWWRKHPRRTNSGCERPDLGERKLVEVKVIGARGRDVLNDNGTLPLSFAEERKLIAINTCYSPLEGAQSHTFDSTTYSDASPTDVLYDQ